MMAGSLRIYERRESGHVQWERCLQQKGRENAQMTTSNGSPAVQIKTGQTETSR